MSDTLASVLIAFIVGLPAIIAALVAAYQAGKARKDIAAVHSEVNSRFAELLRVAKETSRAEGRAEGVLEGKAAKIGAEP